MDAEQQISKAPLGMFNARADDRGRVKFPVNFQKYFESLPDKELFVTSFDRETVRIYPIAVWRQNEEFFGNNRDDEAESVYFTAMRLGEEAEMDGQGRVPLSTDLRKELELTDQPVRIFARDGVITVLGEKVFAKKQTEAETVDKAALSRLRVAGLK